LFAGWLVLLFNGGIVEFGGLWFGGGLEGLEVVLWFVRSSLWLCNAVLWYSLVCGALRWRSVEVIFVFTGWKLFKVPLRNWKYFKYHEV
jgi:hypothetical protein